MCSRNSEFGIFPKNIKGKKIFYYWIYENDKRKFRSTGKKDYEEAIRFCRQLQIKGKLYASTSYSFNIYTKDFFYFDKCPYIKNRLLRGYSYGKTWARKQRKYLEKYIQPYFKDTDIRTISSRMIDDFILGLKKNELGVKSINHILSAVKVIFKYAEHDNFIDFNPAEGVKPFMLPIREKGIFTRQELCELFSNKARENIWKDQKHFLINYIAVTTGMRIGEILALKKENISSNMITVSHSWNRIEGLKSTKNGKTRYIPIYYELQKALDTYINDNDIQGYLFSSNGGIKPLDHKSIYKHFWQSLNKIGIGKTERNTRNLSFHSWRHGFNTMLLEAGINPEVIRLATGHSPSMPSRYSHVQLANMPNVLKGITFRDIS